MRLLCRNQVVRLLVVRDIALLSRRIPLFFFSVFLLLAVAACSFSGGDSSLSKKGSAGAPAPGGLQPPVEKVSAIPTTMDTFRALAKPEGLKFQWLFDERINNTDDRLKRLETVVQTLRNDFDTVMPTMVRMAAIEKDMKNLVSQLQSLTGDGRTQDAAATPEQLPSSKSAGDGSAIPGGGAVEGTEPVAASKAAAGPEATSSLVTPEAAPKG